jgi:CheY-like chemotaxis protein
MNEASKPTTTTALPAAISPEEHHTSCAVAGNILLVEDDELVRQSVGHKLMRLGYRVTSVETPAGAIAFLQTGQHFDLVFTDVIMPGQMTGADLAREVQRNWPATKVLLTSGYTESALFGRIKLPEDARLLSKPYSNADLVATLQQVLSAT